MKLSPTPAIRTRAMSLLTTVTIMTTLLVLAFVSTAAAQPVPVDGDRTLHSGTWTKKTNTIDGSWSIVEKSGRRYIVLDSKFKTTKAPDLKIILSPTAVKDLKSKNAMTKAKVIALLKSHKGAQRFEIPKGVDLKKFKTIAIHCEKYTKLWGASSIIPDKKTP